MEGIPASEYAEHGVLGSVLFAGKAFDVVFGLLCDKDFYFMENRCAFAAMCRLHESGTEIDVVSVAEEIERSHEDFGRPPLDFLLDVRNNTVNADNIEHYAKIVLDKAKQRQVLSALHATKGLIEGGAHTIEDVAEALRAQVDILEDSESSRFFRSPAPAGYERLFSGDLQPPPVLIPGILPREVFGLVGPGGSAKTTLVLWLMVHIILNRDVFGQPISGPGRCLFISAEDPIDTILYRLRKICDAMGLDDLEEQVVGESLFIEDVTGRLMRFVEVDGHSNLKITHHVDDLVRTYQDKNVQLCVMDPAVFFGPGERYTNDSESALMQSARKISRGLRGAAVGYLHHTGKTVAREGIVDQYAGRGGSAFADNSRAMLVLDVCKDDNGDDIPDAIDRKDIEDGRVMRLHVSKYSVGKRKAEPFWILRGEENPWHFSVHAAERLSSHEKSEKANRQQELSDYAALKTIRLYLKKHAAQYPTKNHVRDHCKVFVGDKKLGKMAISGIIDRAIFRGEIREEDVPEDARKGAKKKYLVPAWQTSGIND